MKRALRRLWCALAGHDWHATNSDPLRYAILGHLHPMAGCAGFCRRCDKTWDDLQDCYTRKQIAAPAARVHRC